MQDMTPSTEVITPGQIAKIIENLAAALRKSDILLKGPVQLALQYNGPAIIIGMVEAVCKCAERFCNVIIRHATVDRNEKPYNVLKATGCNLHFIGYLLEAMPNGNGTEVDIFFFKLGYLVNDAGLEKEYELRGFKPVDPYSLAKINKDDRTFAYKHPNCTYWKNNEGKCCSIMFDCWRDGDRDVGVGYSGNSWSGNLWFAGILK